MLAGIVVSFVTQLILNLLGIGIGATERLKLSPRRETFPSIRPEIRFSNMSSSIARSLRQRAGRRQRQPRSRPIPSRQARCLGPLH